MSDESNSTKTGKRFSIEECLEILSQCSLIEASIKALRARAESDFEYQMNKELNKPKLKIVE
jgi:hypothetical protein